MLSMLLSERFYLSCPVDTNTVQELKGNLPNKKSYKSSILVEVLTISYSKKKAFYCVFSLMQWSLISDGEHTDNTI